MDLVAAGAGDAVVVLEQRQRAPRRLHAVAQLQRRDVAHRLRRHRLPRDYLRRPECDTSVLAILFV